MAKRDTLTAMPKLRFSEFQTHWDSIAVSDFFDLASKAEKTSSFDANRLLTVKLHCNGVVKNEKSTLTGGANYFTRKAGQFIFSKIDLLNGAFGIVPDALDEFSSSSDVPAYSFNTEHSSIFFLSWLKAHYNCLQIERTGTSNTLKRVSPEKFLALAVIAPSLAEQQKIADCLTSLDEVIAAQGRKVEALKAHKRGLMQQLFPREGETRPRLRFPEFRDTPKWQNMPLGKVAEIKLGKMLDANKHKSGRLLPFVNNISLRWNEVDTSNLPQMYFKESELERYGLQEGDVLVCEGGEPGRSAVWDGRLPDLKFQKAVHRIRFHVPFVPKIFVLYLEAIAGTNAFESLFTGGGIKHLTGETFAKLTIPVMPLPEQQRIADCLSSLDTQVAAESNQLAALKTHKQGLMQQLFPSPEGVAA